MVFSVFLLLSIHTVLKFVGLFYHVPLIPNMLRVRDYCFKIVLTSRKTTTTTTTTKERKEREKKIDNGQ